MSDYYILFNFLYDAMTN